MANNTTPRQHITTDSDPFQPNDELVTIWILRYILSGNIEKSFLEVYGDEVLQIIGPFLKWTKPLATLFVGISGDAKIKKVSSIANDIRDLSDILYKSRSTWGDQGASLAKLAELHPSAVKLLFSTTLKKLESSHARNKGTIERNINFIGDMLDLGQTQRNILAFASLVVEHSDFAYLARWIRIKSHEKACKVIGGMLNAKVRDVSEAIAPKGVLVTSGLVELDSDARDMEDKIKLRKSISQFIHNEYSSIDDLMQNLLQPSKPAELEMDDYPHLAKDFNLLEAYLSNVMKQGVPGVNILLYGIAGSGKTEFARLLAKRLGTFCVEVAGCDSDGEAANGRERYTSYVLAQKFLSKQPKSLIIFDEVEDVFPGNNSALMAHMFGFGGRQASRIGGKAWVNNLLESNQTPSIWITNETYQIDPAYLRRFSYHIEFRTPPKSVRSKIAAKRLRGVSVSSELIDELSQNSEITPAQLENAAKIAKLSGATDNVAVEAQVRQTIQQSMKVLGQKESKNQRASLTGYNPDLLNLDSRIPVATIIEALTSRPSASLCFYGFPGTGKTMLAEHIASSIDKPLIIKRASDVLSPWVGVAEKNIVNMFREAEEEDAVLLLDEADTFLGNRQNAQRSWEVSQVNELLQGMERFNGIFICTTNLFESLDEAALRRFSFKVRFNYLTTTQSWNLFQQLNTGVALENGESKEKLKQKLTHLTNLTPGDFAVVMRQSTLINAALSPDEMLSTLAQESEIKMDRTGKRMGFIT